MYLCTPLQQAGRSCPGGVGENDDNDDQDHDEKRSARKDDSTGFVGPLPLSSRARARARGGTMHTPAAADRLDSSPRSGAVEPAVPTDRRSLLTKLQAATTFAAKGIGWGSTHDDDDYHVDDDLWATIFALSV